MLTLGLVLISGMDTLEYIRRVMMRTLISFYDDNEKMEIYFGNSNVFSLTNFHEPQTSKNSRASQKKIKKKDWNSFSKV